MNISQITSLLGYMLVCSFTPGPGNILALNTTSKYGWKNSRRLILGIFIGYAAVQTICTIILSFIEKVFSPFLQALKYAGAVYMIWLAIHIIRSSPDNETADKKPTFREGFLLQLVNVKIYFYISTLLSAYFIPNCRGTFSLAAAGAFTVSLGSAAGLCWAFLGIKIQSFYKSHFKSVNIILGIFLGYCAATLLLT